MVRLSNCPLKMTQLYDITILKRWFVVYWRVTANMEYCQQWDKKTHWPVGIHRMTTWSHGQHGKDKEKTDKLEDSWQKKSSTLTQEDINHRLISPLLQVVTVSLCGEPLCVCQVSKTSLAPHHLWHHGGFHAVKNRTHVDTSDWGSSMRYSTTLEL